MNNFELKFVNAKSELPPADKKVLAITDKFKPILAEIWETPEYISSTMLRIIKQKNTSYEPTVHKKWYECSEFIEIDCRGEDSSLDCLITDEILYWAYLPE